jgi:Rps23 Pro-64 3,4-dihydroxylase Tpa1-like proline 4-hydroxylase
MIEVVDNILSKDTLTKVIEHNNKMNMRSLCTNSLHHWREEIIHFSKEVRIYNLDENSEEYKLIEKDVGKCKGILYYYWQPGSYIAWHHDQMHDKAITIYLNDEWNYKDGGLFQYMDKDIKTIIPKHNRGVIQTGFVEHSTTITTTDAPIRKSIQIF